MMQQPHNNGEINIEGGEQNIDDEEQQYGDEEDDEEGHGEEDFEDDGQQIFNPQYQLDEIQENEQEDINGMMINLQTQ